MCNSSLVDKNFSDFDMFFYSSTWVPCLINWDYHSFNGCNLCTNDNSSNFQ